MKLYGLGKLTGTDLVDFYDGDVEIGLFCDRFCATIFSSSLTAGQNKLECLSLQRIFQLNLVFASLAGANPYYRVL
jgi:hypothetical protein